MELPHLGEHCSLNICKKFNFLPIKCDACDNIFCEEHFSYTSHSCAKSYLKNNQVPVCPLCNKPVPIPRGQQPDITVGAHIDRDCQSDSARDRRKVFTNRCSKKGCRAKEIVPILCAQCSLNFCLKHRHENDHGCEGKHAAQRNQALDAIMNRRAANNSQQTNFASHIQGVMTEDEALAKAIALSMQPASSTANNKTQEELDFALAQQLQAESHRSPTTTGPANNSSRDRCTIT